MEIDKNELIKIMTEYWATSNNEECHEKTREFAKKYGFYEDLVEQGFEENFQKMICPNCGKETSGCVSCLHCGYDVQAYEIYKREKSGKSYEDLLEDFIEVNSEVKNETSNNN